MAVRFIYSTLPSAAVARRIGAALLARRLVACVNVLQSSSQYLWKGRLVRAREAVLLLKTDAGRVRVAARALSALHPYEVPCIAQLPVHVNAAFAQWVRASVVRLRKPSRVRRTSGRRVSGM